MESQCLTAKTLLSKKRLFSLLSQTRVLTMRAWYGQPTDLFFMIAAPEGANDTHLAALAELSQYLMKDGFADKTSSSNIS